jgi:catecholate siderophore receptor
MKRSFDLCASVLAASLASTAFAGEGGAAAKKEDETALPEVVVTGRKGYNPDEANLSKLTQPLVSTPQSITVVPKELIEDQGNTTLREVLRNVSGISLAAGEGSSQGDNLTIRGFTARGDLFLDGMRDFGSYYRDPFNYESIEVLQGPSSILFGRGSAGGAVNQVSKAPHLAASRDASFMAGSDSRRRATVDVDEPLPELGPTAAFRVGAMADQGGVAGRNVAQNSRYGFAPSLALGLGTPTRLTLRYFHQSESDIPDYGLPWMFGGTPDVDRRSFYGFTSDFLKADADVVTGRLEHDVSDSLTLRAQLRYADYERHARITEPQVLAGTPSTPLSAITVTRNQLVTDSTEGNLLGQTEALAKFDLGPTSHELVGGVEAGHETSDPTRQKYTGVPTTSLLSPDYGTPFSGNATISSKVQASVDTFGLYALDTIHLGERWDLIGGGRWDYIDSDFDQVFPSPSSFHRLDERASWRGAVVFKPRPEGSVYFAAGNSFDPSAEQLSLSTATANVAPEENRSYELGAKWDLLGGALSLTGALFRQEKLNAREADPNNPLVNALSGHWRVDGFQVGARGKLAEWWQVFAGWTFMDSKVVASGVAGVQGRPLANAPRNSFDFWSDWKLPWDLETGVGVNTVSARAASTTVSSTGVEAGFIGRAPGYTVINAMAQKRFSKRLSLQVSVFNLADEFYLDGIHPSHVIPGAARTVQSTLYLKF